MMNEDKRKKIPVNIISGPLGVGKTTTINHILRLRPENERWAVLVNEYGLVGLDAAFMSTETSGVQIKEVAGGCICCSAGFMFEVSLVLLLQRRPDRLLIEPTGLAALSGILDTLDRAGIREAVDLRSVLCLLDPVQYKESMRRPEVQDQIEAADVLLASRSDLASPQQLHAFHEWANDIFPPKRCIKQIVHGEISIELLDLVVDRDSVVPRAGHHHGTDHKHDAHAHTDHVHTDHKKDAHAHTDHGHTDHEQSDTQIYCDETQPIVQRVHRSEQASTIGWICWEQLIFDAESVSCWLSALSKLPNTLRVKAVLRTNEGWWTFNFSHGVEEVKPSGYRRDSRIEMITEGEFVSNPNDLEQRLQACLISNDALEVK